jgi:DNA helicase II / ATP-dependent DNA helicase PcrA
MSAVYLEKLNHEQRWAVEHGFPNDANLPVDSLLVIVGAESGKINTLAHRVTYLIANGVDPRRIRNCSRHRDGWLDG